MNFVTIFRVNYYETLLLSYSNYMNNHISKIESQIMRVAKYISTES